MSVAFPLGVGIALVLGVIVNYLGIPTGNPMLLFGGVALIVIAIICNGVASERCKRGEESKKNNKKGIIIALIAGVLMSLFYRFVVKGMDVEKLQFSRYRNDDSLFCHLCLFSIGVLLSNFIFNTLVMKYPFVGEKVSYSEYFKGNARTHICGMLGGAIWGTWFRIQLYCIG